MKRASILFGALLLVAFGAAAQSGPSANGDFQFALTGASGAIQFNAKAAGSGATGHITFQGSADISNEDVDGDGSGSSALTGVNLTVSVDCLRVSGNRAALGGVISSSSVAALVGRRALLAVEDGGEGKNAGPDRFTWGMYRSRNISWTPEDAEVPGDAGWSFNWFASDAEDPSDTPVAFDRGTGNVNCQSFGFGSYGFEALPLGAGNINVKP